MISSATDENHGWTDLASAVNKRVAPVILATAVTKNSKLPQPQNTELLIRSPWEPEHRAFYEGTEFGVEGDRNCRRIVIDGSNVARDHGKVAEIKRKVKIKPLLTTKTPNKGLPKLLRNGSNKIFTKNSVKMSFYGSY